jgi:flagellar biosynthesis protein FlhB
MADSSKTEQATPKRKEKAREEGQVGRSRELPGVVALGAVVAVAALMGTSSLTHWTTFYRNSIYTASTSSFDSNGPLFFWSAVEVMHWIAPVLLAAMALSICAGFLQGGVNFAPAALAFKFQRLNPVTKLGQIFSPIGFSNLLKSLLPFAAILWIAATTLRSHWNELLNSSTFGLSMFTRFLVSIVLSFVWKAGLVLLCWSGIDYALTMMKMRSDMKMTKQEVRQEHKETDGNPQIKSRIRRLQRSMRRRQTLKATATATVVVTNPTHYAVALRYETSMHAPEVVAKGCDLLAEKIKHLARESGIMILENKALAQALYKSVEVGDVIPAKLYQAVAEILAIVFRAEAELHKAEAARRSRNASGQKAERSCSASVGKVGTTR